MDAVSLQNFMRLREAAATRIQSTNTSAVRSASDWRTAIDAKRQEMGITTRNNQNNYAVNDFRNIEERATALKSRLALGTPVRKTGNLLDIRA